MPLIYVTGVSGSGKSAVRTELMKRGYKAFGTDEDGIATFYNNETGKMIDNPTNAQGRSPEWYAHHTWKMCRQRVERLALQGKDNPVFLCGGAANDEEVWDLFSQIVALIIDEATLKKRITTRTTNDMGKLPHEYASILEWQKRAEAYYQRINAVLVDATQGIEAVVDEIVEKVSNLARRVNELAAAVLPPKATAIVISPAYADLPRFDAQRVWAFPEPIRRDRRQLFASGAAGSKEAAWIGAEGVYKFCLYGGPAQDTLLASVSVTRSRAALARGRPDEKLARNEAFIAATLNPAPIGSGPGKIAISWSTGDGSFGRVYVSVEDQRVHYPANGAAAIEEMEQLHSKGAEFLLAPHNAFGLFERYPELKGHLDKRYRLLASEENTCLIYDLREAPDMVKG